MAIVLNDVCPKCFGMYSSLDLVPGWDGCGCGTRRYKNGMITLQDLITASGKYPERANHKELTQDVKDNAMKLLAKVNPMLKELGITKVSVSSGWRPSSVNANTKGSSKKSLHMSGFAVDLVGHEAYDAIEKNPAILKKYSLWVEDKQSAPTWTHIDCSETRKDRPIRIFKA